MNHRPQVLNFSSALNGFLQYKLAEGLSPATVLNYERDLKLWLEHMGDQDNGKITSTDLLEFLNYLRSEYVPRRIAGREERKLSDKTIYNFYVSLSAFFTWASTEFEMANPMKKVLRPRVAEEAPVEPFRREEIELLIKACDACAEPGTTLAAWTFTYDGDGTRVKQVYTDGAGTLTTYYFFGGAYEVRTDGSTTVTLKYYSFGGQTILRDADGLKYMLTDHLGSVVAVTDANGTLLSQQRFLPFGQLRGDTPITQTDYGYTGQRVLDAQTTTYKLGLMDYRARFYSPYFNRFTQPDSIIPNLNPQSLNRYSYVINSPLNYIDPSGHNWQCGPDGVYCDNDPSNDSDYDDNFISMSLNQLGPLDLLVIAVTSPSKILDMVGAKFENLSSWTPETMTAVAWAIATVGFNLMAVGYGDTWYEAFRNAYETSINPLVFLWGHGGGYILSDLCLNSTIGGCTTGKSLISFMTLEGTDFQRWVNNVVHELGHVFNNVHGGNPASFAGNYAADRKNILRAQEGATIWQINPFYDPNSPGISNSEMFADMFVAWNFNAWNVSSDLDIQNQVNAARAALTTAMSEWVP